MAMGCTNIICWSTFLLLLVAISTTSSNAFVVRSSSTPIIGISRSSSSVANPSPFGSQDERELMDPVFYFSLTSVPTLVRLGQAKRNDDIDDKEKEKKTAPAGNWFIYPLVALVGADLLVNILFLTKRTFEALVLGHAPSTDTWW